MSTPKITAPTTSSPSAPRSLGAQNRKHEPMQITSPSSSNLSHYLIPHHYKGSVKSILISNGQIKDRVAKLAADIRADYVGVTIHLLCVLKGGSAFFYDLMECLKSMCMYNTSDADDYVPYTFDFIRAKSYDGMDSKGYVQVSGCDLDKLKGKHVLLVEDIIDTGTTMSMLLPLLQSYNPMSCKVASLLEKRTVRSDGFKGDYVGFSVPDEFVVGYCLDYNEVFRDMGHICVISEVGIVKYKDGVC